MKVQQTTEFYMKVLIVDDAEIDTLLCQKIVESLGYTPIAVASAIEARELLNQVGAPDIIILDWMMPEMDGIELCKIIRRSNLIIEPFILMMTANSDRHAEAEALNAGADDFISKPVNRIDLEAKLKLGRRLIKTQLELLLANQRLKEKLEFDTVTGLMSRQAGLHAISASLSRLSRLDGQEGLLVHCVLKFSSKHNHHFKHDLLDKVYFELARNLAQALRQSDVMVRFKDDEFLFFAESEPESHYTVLTRIERAVQQSNLNNYDANLDISTLIAGLVITPEHAMTATPLLLQNTEDLLTTLTLANKTIGLSHLSPIKTAAKVLDFSQFRKRDVNS